MIWEKRLDLNQGYSDNKIFGYDIENKNFVLWELSEDLKSLSVHSVVQDDTEQDCGPLEETRKIAESFLARKDRHYRELLNKHQFIRCEFGNAKK